jgi:alpha-tubulin suppressor-like RCC1 family protein
VIALAIAAGVQGCSDDNHSLTAPERATTVSNTTSALAFYQVSAGVFHTCGVTFDNRAYCWGGGGGIGDGKPDVPLRLRPVAVAGALRFRQLSAGFGYTCGVTTDYRVYCWGYNDLGQLGDGTTTKRSTPVPVAGGLRFRQVEAGSGAAAEFTCGITYSGNRAYCWGYNFDGQLGDGTRTTRLKPVAVLGGHLFRQVSAGGFHACGVTTEDVAFCWGRNLEGELGDSTNAPRRLRPSRVVGGRRWRQVDAGNTHTCGATRSDRAWCWGNGAFGAIGNGRTYLSFWPRAVSGGLLIRRVTAGTGHTCGLRTTNRAYCWGTNFHGELGDGSTSSRLKPVPVAGGLFFDQVSAGDEYTCAKTGAGVAYCWGFNSGGQLGDGTQVNRPTPVPVADAM